MGSFMGWSDYSRDWVREAAALIDQVAIAFRNRGYIMRDAVDQAAFSLDIPKRRARALLYGEAAAMTADEYKKIRVRFLVHLDE